MFGNYKHIALIISGLFVVFLLGMIPKFVVSDKDKSLKATTKNIKSTTESVEETHDEQKILNSKEIAMLKKAFQKAQGSQKLVLADSLAETYKSAFALDSAAITYLSVSNIADVFYRRALQEAITGFRMNSSGTKHQQYKKLCENIITLADKNKHNAIDFQVEKLRFQTFGAAEEGQAPMQYVGQLKQLAEQNPETISAQLALAEFYTTVGKIKEAILRYEQVLKVEKDNIQALLELTNLYLSTNEKVKAQSMLDRLKQLNKTTKDSFVEDFVKKNSSTLNN